jgi:hypothetical protein
MAINGRGLDGELRGEIKEGNRRLERGNEGRASLRA